MSLTTEQWNIAYRKFPGLMSFVINCDLHNEYKLLVRYEALNLLNNHQKNRLAELREFKRNCQRDLMVCPETGDIPF